MWAIDVRPALSENNLRLVRTEDIFRTQSQLPSLLNATGRREDVVVTVALVELRTLDGRILRASCKDGPAFIEQFHAVGTHAADCQNAVDARPAFRKRADEIRLTIVVPERTGIDPALRGFDQMWF